LAPLLKEKPKRDEFPIFAAMKKSLLSVLLTFYVLAGTLSVPVYKHTCHVSDRTDILVLQKKHCCNPGEDRGETSIDFKCCTLDEFDTSISVETLLEEHIDFELKFIPEESTHITFSQPFVSDSDKIHYLRPPPLANRDIHNNEPITYFNISIYFN
jgi:hypothetical protein